MHEDFDLETTAFAFRGYNVTNLGRTAELLADDRYAEPVARYLDRAAALCGAVIGRRVDLVDRVRRRQEATLAEYAEAVALILAVELAQIEILETQFGVKYAAAKMAFGYSLGEITALAAGGTVSFEDALRIPLSMSADCAALAADVTMGILFSRAAVLDIRAVERMCREVNAEGRGVVGVSSYLSPNSLLLLGQRDTIDRFEKQMADVLPRGTHLRRNPDRWPPMHTPIVWQASVPNRAAVMMHTLTGPCRAPRPKVLSMVTGKYSYTDDNARELVAQWIDHPQRLWDVLYETLASGVETVVHVGPEANLIPSTFERIAKNVREQTETSSLARRVGWSAVRQMAERAWLRAVLPARAALLRAPKLRHIRLEAWLLERPRR
jgi:[acyl-carrier-protein] S-malonyltransferase